MENNNYSTFNPNNQSQNINDNQNNQSSNLINNQNIQSSNLNNAQIINNQSNENLLINNNLILREDINRLSDINKNLENELKNQRFKNYQIANQNDTLNKSNLVLSSQINKINCLISNAKMKENN